MHNPSPGIFTAQYDMDYSSNSVGSRIFSNVMSGNPTSTVLRGIYKFDGETLTYCWGPPNKDRPKEFTAPKGSGRTLVSLKPFKTGEEEIQAKLRAVGANLTRTPEGLINGLDFSGGSAGAVLGPVKHLKKLRWVQLRHAKVTAADWQSLTGAKSLVTLDITASHPVGTSALHDMQRVALSGRGITDDTLEGLRRTPRIRELQLLETSVTDAGLRHLGSIRIHSLNLQNARVSDRAIADLVGLLPNLRSLNLSGTAAGSLTAKALSGAGLLQALNLENTLVTDSDMAHLGDLPRLHNLDLGSNVITDDGLSQLRRLPKLEYLTLDGNRMTDKVASIFADGFPALRRVSLDGMGLHSSVVWELRNSVYHAPLIPTILRPDALSRTTLTPVRTK